MKKLSACLVLIISLGFQQLYSQQDSLRLTEKDSVIVSAWMFSLGINVVDDSGDAFNDFTTLKDQWNMVPYPSRISIGRYFESGFGLEAIASYNRYKEGFIIDGAVNPEDKNYFALDTRLSYDLNKLVGETAWFDPYVGAGVGYTEANDIGRGTYNAVLGFRTWFSDHWGLDLNTSGKWSFGDEASNHIQHAAGVIYRFDIKKELSKKGKEKLALLEEQQRLADSVAAAKKAEEDARALADRLEREKEIARLAAEEKAREDALNKRMEDLREALDALGHVFFKYNSYNITDEARGVLAELSGLMNQNPDVHLRVEGHADSRGSAEYNMALSERRASHVMAYMLDQGVAQGQLHTQGFGETRLVNDCADGVQCSEARHRENRRVEFYIIEIK